MKRLALVLLTIALFPVGCVKDDRLQAARDSFQLEPGLRIDLIASEPLVIDPVAFAFDENLRLYVVEDRGYPDPPEGGAPTRLGRVAVLEDTDGDGTYDRRNEFMTGLTYPNGVLPWRGGVFVTCSPDIFYFKDTNGDNVADVKRVVLTGFNNTQTAQIRMSHPTLGLDGWVYISGGLNGGTITSPQYPDRPAVEYTSADGRFDPETFVFEVTGGRSQFGLAFDPYGRRFGCSNRHPVMHTVLEPWFLQRNKHLLFNETFTNVSDAEADAVVFPISNTATTADYIPNLIGRSHAGTFTSASGLMVFNGTALTPDHKGNIFICESAQNLVQRQILHPDGISFRSQLPYEGREFLASTDEWFRPVFLQHGPDGALYLADMHRKVIDHPSYVPEAARQYLDFESGKSDGRIYRIVRDDFVAGKSHELASLNSSATTPGIARALDSQEEWVRNTAHRLLLERRDPVSIPLLRMIAVESPLPECRTRALWLLRSLSSLDETTLMKAMGDSVSSVREQAVELAGPVCGTNPHLMQAVIHLASDESMRVRFNSALALGGVEGNGVVKALAAIAARDGADQWMRAAVFSGVEKRMTAFLSSLRNEQRSEAVAFAAVMHDLGVLYGNVGKIRDCRVLLQEVLSSKGEDEWKISTSLGLAEGMSGRGKDFEMHHQDVFLAILGDKVSKADLTSLNSFITRVAGLAENSTEKNRVRVLATSLLGYTDFARTGKTLEKLLDARNSPELQLSVVSALKHQDDARGAAMLINKDTWSGYSPVVKQAVIAALVSSPAFIQELFSGLERGKIKAPEISSVDRARLMQDENSEISARARILFKDLEGGDRMKVYQEYLEILKEPSNAKSGKTVFERACSSCHTYAGRGGKVGPDLTGVKRQPSDALLLHTLVPSYEVMPAYQAVSIKTTDGQSFSGWLVSETENSLTLRTSFGTDQAVLRANITSLTNSGLSLMPEGLEQSMTKDELKDLIAYLKSGE